MIATFDRTGRNVRRWSSVAVLLSLGLAVVSLTGAVRGQSAAKEDQAKQSDQPPAQPAAAQTSSETSVGAPAAPFTREDAEKLWRDKYADRIISVSGREVNRDQVDEEFVDEVCKRAGSDRAGLALLGMDRDAQGQPLKNPLASRLRTATGAAKLWNEQFAQKLVFVSGHIVNQEQVTAQFVAEVERLTGSGAMGYRARDSIVIGQDGKASPAPRKQARPAAATDTTPSPGETAEDRAMSTLLAKRVAELNFDGVPLSEVVDFLRDAAQANIFVEWNALAVGDIKRDAPVTVRVKNVTFAHALDMVLASVSKGNGPPLGYGLKGGVVRISTLEDLEKDVEIRAYDVRDIVPAEMEMKDLATLIRDQVASDTWRDNGGTTGAIHTTKHKLIVATTESTHRQIRAVLEMLRDEPRQARTEAPDSAAQGTRP